MSLSHKTRIRLPTIQQGLRKGLNRNQIGAQCGVTEKTIDRDMKTWVESGLFEIWLKEEFVDLHNYTRDADPITAYKEIARIVGRMVTRKIEAKTEVTERLDARIHLDVTEDEDRILNRAASILDKKLRAKTKPQSIH